MTVIEVLNLIFNNFFSSYKLQLIHITENNYELFLI